MLILRGPALVVSIHSCPAVTGLQPAALCRHAEPRAPPSGSYVPRRGSSPPSAELGALPFCGQLALTAKTGAESQRRPFPYFSGI